MLSVVLFSLSATFASEDIATDVAAVDDEITVDEPLAVEEDSSPVSADESGDVLSESAIVNSTNVRDYINESGLIKDTVTADELIFEGTFEDLNLTVDRAFKITSNNATLINPNIVLVSDNVSFSGFTINQTKGINSVFVGGLVDDPISNVTVSALTINFVDDCSGDDSVAVDVWHTNYFRLLDSVINYVGNTNGTYINNAIRVTNSNGSEIKGNKINAKLVSAYVPWSEEPAGSENWVSHPVSEGIVVVNATGMQFSDNDVIVTLGNISGYSDTIYSIDFKNSKESWISSNNITSTGNTYIYGIIISGEKFTINNNNITSASNYYANGIDIEGPADGNVYANVITVNSPVSAYGIYSGMNGQNTSVWYSSNEICGNAYNIFGMSLGDVQSYVTNTTIRLDGNYTTGIAYRGSDLTIEKGHIVLISSEIGDESIWEGFGVEAVGVKVIKGNVSVINTTVSTSGKGIYLAGDVVKADLEDNFINVVGNTDKDAYAIYAAGISDLKVKDNTVDYQGATNGTGINYGVYIYNSSDASVSANKFIMELNSASVSWAEVPAGSGIWVSFPISEGVVIEESDNVSFIGNNVTVTFGDVVGAYDTIYSVDFKNSNDATISENNINSTGNTYIYGIVLTGERFVIGLNNITSVSDYYANGIDIEGPAFGSVKENNIDVRANTSAYGIYSGMNGQDTNVIYDNNEIRGNAYNIFGMSLGDVESYIWNTRIYIDGNYSTGIAYRGSKLNIEKGHIVLTSSEIGDESIWEGFGVEAVGVKVIKGNVSVINTTVATPGKGIYLADDVVQADLEGNFINVVANFDKDAYAIYAEDLSKLTVNNNAIDYQGTTNGTGINNGVYISNAEDVTITNNNFTLELISAPVSWSQDPSGAWISTPISEGIVIEDSEDVTFDNNNVTVTLGGAIGAYDTIYSVDIIDSTNVLMTNNDIKSEGYSYIYGVVISADNFTVKENNINSTGDYYANGIDVEGPAVGVIDNNTIVSTATNASYPIYGAMSNGEVEVEIKNNQLDGNAYLAYGIQMGGDKVAIENNKINVEGNYTVGISAYVNEVLIADNEIVSNASNTGNETTGDRAVTEGILIGSGDANIVNNKVNTTGDKAVNTGDNVAVVSNNTLESKNGTGKDAIGGDKVYDSVLNTTLVGTDLTKVYGDNNKYAVTLSDQNGTPIAGKIIIISINGITSQEITDQNGVAEFSIDLTKGTYTVQAFFNGTVAYNAKNTTNTIVVNPKPTAITAPSTTLLATATKSGVNYKIVLKDDSGNALANQKVTVVFNGKTSTVSTDANGQAVYKIVYAKAGNLKMTLSFAGDDKYAASTATATIKINKEASKLTAKKKTFKAKVKNKKYTAVLKDSKGKAIKKVKVTLKVKGKTYKATTNAKGKATFKIKNLKKKGKYTATVKFAGNNLYKSATKKVKITVKK